MVRVVADQPLAHRAGAGHDVEVVHVVAGRGHGRAVPAVGHQHDVAGAHLRVDVDGPLVRGVDALVADGVRGLRGRFRGHAGLEVVDLLEPGLPLPLLVVLVRRVGGPVPGRSDHLAHDEPVRLQGRGRPEVADLAGAVARTAQLQGRLVLADQTDGVLVAGGGAGHGHARPRLGPQLERLLDPRVEHVRGAMEDGLAPGQVVGLTGHDGGHVTPGQGNHDSLLGGGVQRHRLGAERHGAQAGVLPPAFIAIWWRPPLGV